VEAWTAGDGEAFYSTSPATGERVWEAAAAAAADVTAAIRAAREAQSEWAERPVAERIKILEAGAAALEIHGDDLHAAIVAETGKPHWEVATEIKAMAAKPPRSTPGGSGSKIM